MRIENKGDFGSGLLATLNVALCLYIAAKFSSGRIYVLVTALIATLTAIINFRRVFSVPPESDTGQKD